MARRFRIAAIGFAVVLGVAALSAQKPAPLTPAGGDQLMYIGTYAGTVSYTHLTLPTILRV